MRKWELAFEFYYLSSKLSLDSNSSSGSAYDYANNDERAVITNLIRRIVNYTNFKLSSFSPTLFRDIIYRKNQINLIFLTRVNKYKSFLIVLLYIELIYRLKSKKVNENIIRNDCIASFNFKF